MTKQATKKKNVKKVETKKEKAWYREHLDRKNEVRREMYASDADYRASRMEESRARYRQEHGVFEKDCRENLDALDSIGSMRLIKLGKKQLNILTFNNRELAEALGYSLVQVYRWQNDGRLPKPRTALSYEEGLKGRFMCSEVYTEDEVKAIMSVLGEHQQSVAHYRTTHTLTIKKMFSAFNKAKLKGK
jgi:hypothetical protein